MENEWGRMKRWVQNGNGAAHMQIMEDGMMEYRKIEAADDGRIAEIIRGTLELDHLSVYYNKNPSRRAYFVALDERGRVIGGAGAAEFDGIADCAELQKLYLEDSAKGKGYGKELMRIVEDWARAAGYKRIYLETHTNLSAAMRLYEKMGFQPIEKPCSTPHGAMNCFYLKEI